MKQCSVCGRSPVFKGDGFCRRHHRVYVWMVREFRVNFIAFMKQKERGGNEEAVFDE